MRKLLIPIAYLPSCQQALEFGAGLSRSSGASLTVLHVAPSVKDAPLGQSLSGEKLAEWGIEPTSFHLLRQAEVKLDALNIFRHDAQGHPLQKHALKALHKGLYEVHLIGTHDQDVRFRITAGQPVQEILHEAEDPEYDLIITGTRGQRGLLRLFRGSVAQEVANGAPCSILVGKDLRSDQSILVGATGRPTSIEAVRQAAGLARQLNRPITVLAIARSPEEQRDAERHAEAAVTLLAEMDLSAKGIVRRGDPARVMIEEAGQAHILALGRLERSQVKRYILGDVSLRVLAEARCPVLIAARPRMPLAAVGAENV
jgi:nucleotide-binding universal stress UspA family protein